MLLFPYVLKLCGHIAEYELESSISTVIVRPLVVELLPVLLLVAICKAVEQRQRTSIVAISQVASHANSGAFSWVSCAAECRTSSEAPCCMQSCCSYYGLTMVLRSCFRSCGAIRKCGHVRVGAALRRNRRASSKTTSRTMSRAT